MEQALRFPQTNPVLPVELWNQNILIYSDEGDLITLLFVCKAFHGLAKEQFPRFAAKVALIAPQREHRGYLLHQKYIVVLKESPDYCTFYSQLFSLQQKELEALHERFSHEIPITKPATTEQWEKNDQMINDVNLIVFFMFSKSGYGKTVSQALNYKVTFDAENLSVTAKKIRNFLEFMKNDPVMTRIALDYREVRLTRIPVERKYFHKAPPSNHPQIFGYKDCAIF